MSRSSFGLFVASVVVLGMLGGCLATQSPRGESSRSITIAATTFPASAPVYVAEEKGFFADEGLDAEVLVYEAGIVTLEDAIAGKVDYATVAETPIARKSLENKAFKILMSIAEVDRANYIIARTDRGIESAENLRGKRIGFVPGTTGDFFLHIYLTTSRIPSSAIKEVQLTPDQSASALLEGKVDAVSTWPPFTEELKRKLGDRALVLDEPGLYTMYWNVVTGARPSAPDVDTSGRLIRAVSKAEEYMETHPAEAIAIAARKCEMDPDELRAQWQDFKWKTSLSQTLLLALEDEARWMVDAEIVPGGTGVPDFLGRVDSEALANQYPAEVTIVDTQVD